MKKIGLLLVCVLMLACLLVGALHVTKREEESPIENRMEGNLHGLLFFCSRPERLLLPQRIQAHRTGSPASAEPMLQAPTKEFPPYPLFFFLVAYRSFREIDSLFFNDERAV